MLTALRFIGLTPRWGALNSDYYNIIIYISIFIFLGPRSHLHPPPPPPPPPSPHTHTHLHLVIYLSAAGTRLREVWRWIDWITHPSLVMHVLELMMTFIFTVQNTHLYPVQCPLLLAYFVSTERSSCCPLVCLHPIPVAGLLISLVL